jgi:hypothetical protein
MTQHVFDQRSRVWLPAVAAVAALVVSGIVALTHQTDSKPDRSYWTTFTATRLPADSAEVKKDVDQCWASAQKLRKTVQYPDRSEWRPVVAISGPGSRLIAMRTKHRPLFCEVTQYSVSLSDPAADPVFAPGTRTGALFATDGGSVAGVVDQGWSRLTVGGTYMGEEFRNDATVQDGLFVFLSYMPATKASVVIRRTERDPQIPLPKPHPAFGTVDAGLPKGDRSSSSGAQLSRCIDEAGTQVPEAESWNPGGRVKTNSEQLTLAANAMGISACVEKPGEKPVFLPYLTTRTWAAEPTLLPNVPSIGGRPVLAGILPFGVDRMRLTFAGGSTMDAAVGTNTFAALPPSTPTSCTLYGADNQILYAGPITPA